MALRKMIVSASKGSDSSLNAEFPYQFYAKLDERDQETEVVNLVMPFGGKETGLFRYPKTGESILVDQDEANVYYLLGYLPSEYDEKNNFLTNQADSEDAEDFKAEKQALQNEEGMILRYQQTGKVDPSTDDPTERYSEIGFYKRPTQWRSNDSSYKGVPDKPEQEDDESDEDYSTRLAKEFPKEENESDEDHIHRVMTPVVFPKIDQMNIQSTGDIYATAKNHQRLKAKRFELLVNCDDTIHTKAELEKDELPLGDNVGDDSVLHGGDAHIRAGNRVVIKAAEEIILQVGKTVVKISDDGLDVISKLVNSNLTNAYDATFNMSGKDGISMFGREVNITSDKSFGVGDTYGGSISSDLGILSIGGREIKAEVYDSVQYGVLVTHALAQYIQSIASGSMAVNGNVSGGQVLEYIKFSYDTLKDGADLIQNIMDVVKEWKEFQAEKNELYVQQGDKADTEAEAAKQQADEEAEAAKQQADEEAEAIKRQADLDKANGKITEEKAAQIKAEADAEAAKKKAAADAEAAKKKIDADTTAAKKKADGAAASEKIAADEAAANEKKRVDDELIAGRMTPEDAEAAKNKADADAEAAKKKADADADAAKKKADIDKEVSEGKKTPDAAQKEKDQADKEANEKKQAADANAEAARKKADAEADKKKKVAEVNAEATKKKTAADAEAAKKKADIDNEVKEGKKTPDVAQKEKAQADREADEKKRDADNEAREAKKKADADAKAAMGTGNTP